MTQGHSGDNQKQSHRVMRSEGVGVGGGRKGFWGETSKNDKDEKRKRGDREAVGGRGPGGVGVLRERFYHSYYFEETALICTPPEQLMSIIHQRDAFMRRCRGNIMPTALSL